ncbi:hypothetical protein Pcinc_036402 [Petrolisthes cinctipes]|uniref:Uncharacterized protein n=1 Tax=Petrolisthes cinctipes TaxID=88211 RepID=A0AAE1BW81_PETCI|nr:hypothetical protein Pcinc_036402 [Petrolisthes cinctipes]
MMGPCLSPVVQSACLPVSMYTFAGLPVALLSFPHSLPNFFSASFQRRFLWEVEVACWEKKNLCHCDVTGTPEEDTSQPGQHTQDENEEEVVVDPVQPTLATHAPQNPSHPQQPSRSQSIHHFEPSPSTISHPVHPPFHTQSIHHFEPSPSTISNPVHPPFHTQSTSTTTCSSATHLFIPSLGTSSASQRRASSKIHMDLYAGVCRGTEKLKDTIREENSQTLYFTATVKFFFKQL